MVVQKILQGPMWEKGRSPLSSLITIIASWVNLGTFMEGKPKWVYSVSQKLCVNFKFKYRKSSYAERNDVLRDFQQYMEVLFLMH